MGIETVMQTGSTENFARRSDWSWLTSVCKSLFVTAPAYLLLCVSLYIVSQVALLAALLLPWKVLLVLSSDRFPKMLPSSMEVFTRPKLLLFLSISAVFAFLLHLACETGINHVCRRGAVIALGVNRKLELFNGHRQHAAALYQRLLRSVAAGACCVLIACWLTIYCPLLLVAFLTYLCLGLFGVVLWRRSSWRQSDWAPNSDMLLKAWWAGGFLYMLMWLAVHHHRVGDPIHPTIAAISLLLIRQALIFCSQLFQNFLSLSGQQAKLKALFLSETPWLPDGRSTDDFEELLQPEKRQWVLDVLQSYASPLSGELSIGLQPVEAGKVVYVTVHGIAGEESYLLKLFHRSQESLIFHEQEILRVAGPTWPAPPLLGSQSVGKHSCLVFGWRSDTRMLGPQERTSWIPTLRRRLLECELPYELISSYDRSQPTLSERLRSVDWNFLSAVASPEVADLSKVARGHWDDVLSRLEKMPRQIVLPYLDRRNISIDGSSSIAICNWTRWRWEPVGSGWPIRQQNNLEALRSALERASRARNELLDVRVEQAGIAAALFEFERLLTLKEFTAALDVVKTICERLEGSRVWCRGA